MQSTPLRGVEFIMDVRLFGHRFDGSNHSLKVASYVLMGINIFGYRFDGRDYARGHEETRDQSGQRRRGHRPGRLALMAETLPKVMRKQETSQDIWAAPKRT